MLEGGDAKYPDTVFRKNSDRSRSASQRDIVARYESRSAISSSTQRPASNRKMRSHSQVFHSVRDDDDRRPRLQPAQSFEDVALALDIDGARCFVQH